MTKAQAYAGIDVACAKSKPLPVNVSVLRDGILVPLMLREATVKPPRSAGNICALDPEWVANFAKSTAAYLHAVEVEFDVSIQRIAIDAPSEPKLSGEQRRKSEVELDHSIIRNLS